MNQVILLISLLVSAILSAPLTESTNRIPTLMISLDGFRSISLEEFLRENPNSYLQKEFVEVGVKAEYMKPSFPTLTFPNHYTIVTGLYMESHGIVGNALYDPDYQKKINFLRDSDSLDPKWWDKAEPIWLTARNQGLKTASFFWTGSEVWTRNPDVFLSYTNAYKFNERCEEVVNWLSKFEMDFVTLYFNEPDHTGHSYGGDSIQYKRMIAEVDKVIGYLLQKLNEAELLNKINVVVVSDHGMATMRNKTIIVKDVVDVNLINANKTIYGIVSNIYPKNESVKQKVYDSLKQVEKLRVFYKEEMPEDLHFQSSNRIAPIVAIADEGYVMNTVTQTLAGNHGFDNSVESMRAIFLARGPDFKRNFKLGPIKNVDVYPMLCEILKINCRPNNGTIQAIGPGLNDFNFSQTTLNF